MIFDFFYVSMEQKMERLATLTRKLINQLVYIYAQTDATIVGNFTEILESFSTLLMDYAMHLHALCSDEEFLIGIFSDLSRFEHRLRIHRERIMTHRRPGNAY